ncbi:MAG: pirin family protein [Candidatus Eremiobacteraeota bacterium]|nr:pirin family protein [Candidatus Eremiobacteraeota bacterium]
MNSATIASPAFITQRSHERYHADHGWLDAYHSFSFADYYDPQNLSWGALRVFNDDTIAAGQGFPAHPHRDMEIITYVLHGALEHTDSMGNSGTVKDGGVQFMSAGTGVRHSEVNGSPTEPLHLVQMWVLPGKAGVKPTYGQHDFAREDRRNTWLLVASGQPGVAGAPVPLTQNASLRVARLEDAALGHVFEPKRFGFIFVADGEISIEGEFEKMVRLQKGDALKTYDLTKLELRGSGEIVMWDTVAA